MLLDVPEIHLSFCNIAEASEHEALRKGADLDRVTEALAELESGLALAVIQGRRCRLLSRDYYEFFAVWGPLYILNLIIECRNESPGLSLVYFYILERVLSVIALAGGVVQVLGPHEDRVAGRRGQDLNVLGPRTSDVELWPLQLTL